MKVVICSDKSVLITAFPCQYPCISEYPCNVIQYSDSDNKEETTRRVYLCPSVRFLPCKQFAMFPVALHALWPGLSALVVWNQTAKMERKLRHWFSTIISRNDFFSIIGNPLSLNAVLSVYIIEIH